MKELLEIDIEKETGLNRFIELNFYGYVFIGFENFFIFIILFRLFHNQDFDSAL